MEPSYAALHESNASAQFGGFSPRTEARINAVTGEVEELQAAARRQQAEFPSATTDEEQNKTVMSDIRDFCRQTYAEFRFRPVYTLAEICTVSSMACLFVSVAAPWLNLFIWDDNLDLSRGEGGIRLLSLHMCTQPDSGKTATANARTCTTVELADIAANADYLRSAGGTTFGLLVTVAPLLYLTWGIVRARRKESIDDSWFLQRFAHFRTHILGALLCCTSSLLLLLAWSTYHTTVLSAYNGATLALVLRRLGGYIDYEMGGGYAFTVIAWLAMTYTAIVVFFYPVEPNNWREYSLPRPQELLSVHTSPHALSASSAPGIGSSAGGGVFQGSDTSAAAFFAAGGTQSPGKGRGTGMDSFAGIAAGDPGAVLLEQGLGGDGQGVSGMGMGAVTDL